MHMAELPHISIQILPFTAEGLSAFSTPFLYAESHGSTLETTLVETPASSLFLHDTASVANYRTRFDRLRAAALPTLDTAVAHSAHDSRDSLGLIQHILSTLQEH
ncbi:Scr1 family TA system antitoxin-like transcriptional regulator [Streptomyces sp. H27-D2]|uniref:Scr1 family TA system antitoxin-like transcriptional regulator n=1 Tax=Streptomyces sp. H27-D2 TaxID=3046304 RepID=UPI002DBC0FD0|nr:Scr1 family TA system antitoxin-like transcriptional regulator [Streptomyces sp. H27-D2]MEC4016416.1 Scr1 family TA system antitoxin-like transcriptional regulator [Streptomyces sp. H27-D2]